MDNTKWLTLVMALFLACGREPTQPEAADPVHGPEGCTRSGDSCTDPEVVGVDDSPAQPELDDTAKGTQTGGSGGNPCLVSEVEWSEAEGTLPQIGTWRGDFMLRDGGDTSATLTVEQRGPVWRSAAQGCTDLQRAEVEYTLRIDGVLSASRAGELFDQLEEQANPEIGYAQFLATRIAPSELEPGVVAPRLVQFVEPNSEAPSDAGVGDLADAGGPPSAAMPTVKLALEVTFEIDRATVNLDWVCIDCGDSIANVLPLGDATLERE